MPRIRAICFVPAGTLPLPPGLYGDPGKNGVELLPASDPLGKSDLMAAVDFHAPENLTADEEEQKRLVEAQRLVTHLNRLIRWCRALGGRPDLRELALGQVTVIRFFRLEGTPSPGWGHFADTTYFAASAEDDIQDRSLESHLPAIRERFAAGEEPPVGDLLLADAIQFVREGRFRESVLACWSVIDATFNQRFEALVAVNLADEWKESRDFLTGPDFGLRHKMGIGLRLATGRSLFKEPDAFWSEVDRSYKCRNKIIHEGAVATEADARRAIGVAQQMVRIMKTLGVADPTP